MCEICHYIPCLPVCPNYIPPIAQHYCSICDEGIHEGEEYITNSNHDYAHWNCIEDRYDLLDWLGEEKMIMKGEDT